MKKLTAFLSMALLLLGHVKLQAQAPANDNFVNRATLTGTTADTTGSNVGATKETGEPNHYNNNSGGKSVWWTWTASVAGSVRVTTTGSSFDTLLAVYTGNAVDALDKIASNDDSGSGGTSSLSFSAEAGITYQIVVDGYSGSSGSVALHLAPVVTVEITALSNPPNVGSFNGDGAVSSGETVYLEASPGLPGYLFSSWQENGSVVSTDASYSFTATADRTLTAFFTVVQIPANDNFAFATLLSGATPSTSGTTIGASGETGEPYHDGYNNTGSVWWKWVAPATGPITVEVSNNAFRAAFGVYTGTAVDSLSQVTSGRTSNDLTKSSFNAVAGTTYYFAVTAQSSTESGTFTLSLSPALQITVLTNPATGINIFGDGPVPANTQITLSAVSALPGFKFRDYTEGGVVVSTNPYYSFTAVTSRTLTANFTTVTPPPNDNFASRIALPNSTTVNATGKNDGASRETDEPDYYTGYTVWWSWTAPSTGNVVVDTVGSDFSTYLAIYTGTTLNDLSSINSNSGSGANSTSRLKLNAVSGTTYYIQVDGTEGKSGNISLHISPTPVITASSSPLIAGTTSGSGNYYKNDTVEMSVSDSQAGYQFSNWTENGVVVSTTNFYTFTATTSRNLVANFAIVPIPANDNFANRIALPGNGTVSTTGRNVGASPETGEPAHNYDYANRSVWWSWTAPVTGPVAVDTKGSNFTTALGIYTGGSVNALTIIYRDSENGSGTTAAFNAIAGTTYQIAVDGYTAGDIVLHIAPGLQITTSINLPNIAYISGGGPVANGSTVYLNTYSIDAVAGYQFSNWTEGATVVSTTPNFSFTATANRTLVANYVAITPPPNNNFANRIFLSAALPTTTGNNAGASLETNERALYDGFDNFGGELKKSIWWSWTAPSTGNFVVTATGNLQPTVALFTGTALASLNAVALNSTYVDNFTTVGFSAVAGVTYQVAVSSVYESAGTLSLQFSNGVNISTQGFPSNKGYINGGGIVAVGPVSLSAQCYTAGYAFSNWTENGIVVSTSADYNFTATVNRTLVANFVTVPIPVNDSFANRIALSGFTPSATATSLGSSYEDGEPYPGFGNQNNSLWWEWTAPASGPATIDTKGSNFNTVLAVYTGTTLRLLSKVAADDQSGGQNTSLVTFNAAAGTTYRILVDGYGSGNIALNIRSTDPTPPPVTPPAITYYSVTVKANPKSKGTVTGGGSFAAGSTVTVKAKAKKGKKFVAWKEGAKVVGKKATYKFVLGNKNRSLTATFK